MRRHHLADSPPSLEGSWSSLPTTLGGPLRQRADAQRGRVRLCPSVLPNRAPSVKHDKMQSSKILGRNISQINGILHTHLRYEAQI